MCWQDWNRTSGYSIDAALGRESYDYRPGVLPYIAAGHPVSVPPSCLPQVFASLGNACRVILEAIGRSLDLRSYAFHELLDNTPLKVSEESSSVLSATCYGRRSVYDNVNLQLQASEDTELRAEKGLLALVRSDRPGLHIRMPNDGWLLVDAETSASDFVLLTGLALHQATGGYVTPGVYKVDATSAYADPHQLGLDPGALSSQRARVSLSFKLMPRSSAILHCAALTAAGHMVPQPFHLPVSVQDFMIRQHPLDQISSKSMGLGKRKRRTSRVLGVRPLAPSKRLRMEAQRVLKEKVQDLAEMKGIKVRFCNKEECEQQHMGQEGVPCQLQRMALGWPETVPFVHPHDLPNQSKQVFLEHFEPGWTAAQDGDFVQYDGAPGGLKKVRGGDEMLGDEARFSLKAIYEYLRERGKPVPTGKPQVIGHRVNIPLLTRLVFEAGGRHQFALHDGFNRFIHDNFNLETASEKDKERAFERLVKLYDQVIGDYMSDILLPLLKQRAPAAYIP
eukprot:SM000075S21915  [mRNA]  locus=s75:54710:57774:+ [translate_table: standard]